MLLFAAQLWVNLYSHESQFYLVLSKHGIITNTTNALNCSVCVILNYVDSPAPQVLIGMIMTANVLPITSLNLKCQLYFSHVCTIVLVFKQVVGDKSSCVLEFLTQNMVSHLTRVSTFLLNPDSWFLIKLLIRYVLLLENMLVNACLLSPVLTAGKQSKDCLLCINSVIFSGTVKLAMCFWLYENRS